MQVRVCISEVGIAAVDCHHHDISVAHNPNYVCGVVYEISPNLASRATAMRARF